MQQRVCGAKPFHKRAENVHERKTGSRQTDSAHPGWTDVET